jgi:uncharacterized protein DUF5990
MFRRLKIRLGHLGGRDIRCSVSSGTPLTVKLRLTDAHGGPLCATPPASHLTGELPGVTAALPAPARGRRRRPTGPRPA